MTIFIQPKYIIWHVLIVFAAWNAVLRPSISIPITPYYALTPLVSLILIIKIKWVRKWYLLFSVFTVYGMILGIKFGVPLIDQILQLIKYLQLLTFFILLTWLYYRKNGEVPQITWIVFFLTFCILCLAIVQNFSDFEFPTVINKESHIWINTFFYTPNDLALFMCAIFVFIVCGNYSVYIKSIYFISFFALSLRNDAKAAALACLLVIFVYSILLTCKRFKIKPIWGLAVVISITFSLIFLLAQEVFLLGNSEFNLGGLLLDPIKRIVNLDPYNLGGSIFDRTDALIHSINAFIGSYGFGIGPGGTVYNLELPENRLLTAKSIHNAIAEVFFEFGFLSVLIFIFILKPFFVSITKKSPTSNEIKLICLVICSPLLSVSQSSGFISNYAFWFVAFLIWYPVYDNHRYVGKV